MSNPVKTLQVYLPNYDEECDEEGVYTLTFKLTSDEITSKCLKETETPETGFPTILPERVHRIIELTRHHYRGSYHFLYTLK